VKNETPTTPPSAADADVAAFERALKDVGENRARWDALMALLEERNNE
jgi:hypothetical protein